MELDLKSFSITLAGGVFVLASIAILLYLFYDSTIVGRILHKVASFQNGAAATIGALLVIVVFGCGIVGETLSNKLVDDDKDVFPFTDVLQSEKFLRKKTLLGDRENPIPPLAKELALKGAFSDIRSEDPPAKMAAEKFERLLVSGSVTHVSDLDEKMRDSSSGMQRKISINGVIQPFYYHARNTLMDGKDAISSELATIQRRLDFCRSISFYSAASYVAIVIPSMLLCLYAFGRSLRTGAINRLERFATARIWPCISADPPPPALKTIPTYLRQNRQKLDNLVNRLDWKMIIWVSVGYLMLFMITRYCHSSEEREYNIRVFGYYSTIHKKTIAAPVISYPIQRDISGAIRLLRGELLLLTDEKFSASGGRERVSLLKPATGEITDLAIRWPEDLPEIASDLEAACGIPGSEDILLCESGYFMGKYGRVFRCTPRYKPDGGSLELLEVKSVLSWPHGTEDIEGVICTMIQDQTCIIAARRDGAISWGPLPGEKDPTQIVFTGKSEILKTLLCLKAYNRRVSDLYLRNGNEIWASAAYEPEDSVAALPGRGPYNSLIYRLGSIQSNTIGSPVKIDDPPKLRSPVEGFKVEALCAGSAGDTLFFGTDDEQLGGVWRFLRVSGVTPWRR